MERTGARRWRVCEAGALLVEEWPDEIIVFNRLSGETHQLNEAAAYLLELLLACPQTVETLSVKYCDKFQMDGTGDMESQVVRLLEEFDDLGLIEPVE